MPGLKMAGRASVAVAVAVAVARNEILPFWAGGDKVGCASFLAVSWAEGAVRTCHACIGLPVASCREPASRWASRRGLHSAGLRAGSAFEFAGAASCAAAICRLTAGCEFLGSATRGHHMRQARCVGAADRILPGTAVGAF